MAEYKRKNVSARKRKRKKKKSGVVFRVLMILIVLMIVAVAVAVSPVCNISKVSVEGNRVVTTKSILDTAKLPIGGNAFYTVEGSLIDKVFMTWQPYKDRLRAKYVYIKNVDFKFGLGGKLVIKITERTPFLYLPFDKKFALVDAEGVILNIVSKKPNDNRMVLKGFAFAEKKVGGQTKMNASSGVVKVNRLIKLFQDYQSKLPKELISRITAFDVSKPNNIAMDLTGDIKVLLGEINDYEDSQLIYRLTFINASLAKIKVGEKGTLDYATTEDLIWKVAQD
ncbi:MAG: cell division protein FtsQ/DivIB [Clostridia bacterium]